MAVMELGLDDRCRLDAKRIFLSGTQALVRLPMLQRERDRAQGLNTAGFISGYRGSPLGMYDTPLWGGAASRSGCFPAPGSMACSASGMAKGPASTVRWTRSSMPTRLALRPTAA